MLSVMWVIIARCVVLQQSAKVSPGAIQLGSQNKKTGSRQATRREFGRIGLRRMPSGQLNEPSGIAASLNNLGQIAEADGDWDAAEAYYDESLDIFRSLGDKFTSIILLLNLTLLKLKQDQVDTARRYLDEGLTLGTAVDATVINLWLLICAIDLWLHERRSADAAAWLAVVENQPRLDHEMKTYLAEMKSRFAERLASQAIVQETRTIEEILAAVRQAIAEHRNKPGTPKPTPIPAL